MGLGQKELRTQPSMEVEKYTSQKVRCRLPVHGYHVPRQHECTGLPFVSTDLCKSSDLNGDISSNPVLCAYIYCLMEMPLKSWQKYTSKQWLQGVKILLRCQVLSTELIAEMQLNWEKQ